jgi:IclR family acetate operon transcriptional repressor
MAKRTPKITEPATEDSEGDADKGAGLRVGTLLRGLAILDILIPAGYPLSLAEVATEAQLDLSTTLRLLRTLEEARQVIRMGDGKRYMASPKALRPLPLLHPLEQLRREVDPILRELAAKVAKTVVLVVYLGGERVVVEVMQSAGSLSPYYSTWLHGPLYASAPGKALLLSTEPARRKALLGDEPYAAFTQHTLTSWDAVEQDLALAAQRGYVLVQDEFYEGLSAIAVNFQTWAGRAVGCIALTGHSADFNEDTLGGIVAELKACARLMPLQGASLKLLDQLAGRY